MLASQRSVCFTCSQGSFFYRNVKHLFWSVDGNILIETEIPAELLKQMLCHKS